MFVTFEGIDGSGKTTQARRFVDRLREAGIRPLFLREPGGTALSEAIRDLLLDPDRQIAPMAELMMFSAARAQLVEERIRPALERDVPVVCDRFYDSTTAYQSGGRGVVEVAWIEDLHRRVTDSLAPDRTYYIEVTLEEALRRRNRDRDAGGTVPDRMESSEEAFYERVIEAYRDLADREPERVIRIDGEGSPDAVHRRIWSDYRRWADQSDGTHS